MNSFTRIMGIGILALAVFAAPRAEAGRIGGALAEVVTIMPGQTISFDVPFTGQAMVAVMGNGAGTINLSIHDADGHVAVGSGAFERQVATMNVYRAGYFRVVVSNTGAVASTVTIGTN